MTKSTVGLPPFKKQMSIEARVERLERIVLQLTYAAAEGVPLGRARIRQVIPEINSLAADLGDTEEVKLS